MVAKVKKLRVAPALMVGALTAGPHCGAAYEVIEDPLPADAKVVRAEVLVNGDLQFFIESETFPEAQDDGEIQYLKPVLRRQLEGPVGFEDE